MIKRLTLSFALSLMTAPTLLAASVPSQATDHIPWAHLPQIVLDAICAYLGLC